MMIMNWLGLLLVVALVRGDDHESYVTVETLKAEDDVVYLTPTSHPDVFFSDHFDDEEAFNKKWIKSKAMKAGVEAAIARYDGEWALEKAMKDPLNNDLGLVMKSKAKHAAISAPLGKVFKFDDKPLVVQYELNFQVFVFVMIIFLLFCFFLVLILIIITRRLVSEFKTSFMIITTLTRT